MTTVTTAMQQLLNEDTTSTRPNFVPTFGGNISKPQSDKKTALGKDFWKPRLPENVNSANAESTMIKFVVRLLPNKSNTNPTISRKQFYVPSERTYIPMMDNANECPMNKFRWDYYNAVLKPLSKEDRKEMALGTERTTNYINVLVIDDPVTPENNSKIFIMPYTRQIEVAMADSAKMMEIDDVWDCFTYEDGYNFNIIVKAQAMPAGDIVPNYVKSTFAPRKTSLTDEQKELAMDSRFELIESIPDLRDSLSSNYKDQIIKKMREVWGNSINGVPLPSLGKLVEVVDNEEPTVPKGKELLTETEPTKEVEKVVEEEQPKVKPKKTTMEKVADEQNNIKDFESKLDFMFD